LDIKRKALALHRDGPGKIEVVSKVPVRNKDDLSLAYTPGVAEPCLAIAASKPAVYEYTAKGNLVAVVSDGSAVLGLGDIGPEAAMPVMEGKAVLFKKFAGVDAFPLCVASKEVEDIVQFVKMIAPTFGGVNLEDISAPRCFEIERKLKAECDIPVFHDDQHGTAVVVAAALINALKVVGKEARDVRVVVNGAGASGIAVSWMLLELGVGDVITCDSKGAISRKRNDMNEFKKELAERSNVENMSGSLADVVAGADVFVGCSVAGALRPEVAATMKKGGIIFALANPVPEIMPEDAFSSGAEVVATGRSDFPNQVNNVLAFPGILKGALAVRAKDINEQMKIAAARAIASLVEPRADCIIPNVFDRRVGPAVAAAVAQAAMDTHVARVAKSADLVRRETEIALL